MDLAPFPLPVRSDLDGSIAAQLRALGPVAPVALPQDVTAWAVTSYRAVRQTLDSPQISKDPKYWAAWQARQIPRDWELASWVLPRNMFTTSGDRHKALRAPIAAAFTSRRVDRLRPAITQITRRLLDQMADLAASGPIDLKQHLALPLPLAVISELFGVPKTDRDHLQQLCAAAFDQTTDGGAAYSDLTQAFGDLAAHKADNPGDDLTSHLIQHAPYTPGELTDTLMLLIGAGYETTVNLICNAVRALATEPDQLALLTTNPAIDHETVVEETLRWASPIAALPLRYTTAPTRIADTDIPAGQPVLVCYGAANRDRAHFGGDADQFNLRRPLGGHLAFGHGPHFCLGASLARLEARIALAELFARFHIELAVPVNQLTPMQSLVATGVTTLPVNLTPIARLQHDVHKESTGD